MRRRISHGTSLLEIILAVGIASILTLTLVLLFSHSHSAYSGEEDRSEELRNLAKTMQTLSDRLTQGTVYLLGPQDKLLKGESSTEITIEQFSELYDSDKISTLSLKNNQMAHSVKKVSFRFQFPRTLEITLQGDHFSLQTEISNVKFSSEGTQ